MSCGSKSDAPPHPISAFCFVGLVQILLREIKFNLTELSYVSPPPTDYSPSEMRMQSQAAAFLWVVMQEAQNWK